MAWLPLSDAETDPFERWLGLRPELLDLFRTFSGSPWQGQGVPPELLELCRRRICQLHDIDAGEGIVPLPPGKLAALADWPAADALGPLERAALTIAENMPWAHHSITDDDYAALREHLDERAVVAFTVAIALFDAVARLRLVFDLRQDVSSASPG